MKLLIIPSLIILAISCAHNVNANKEPLVYKGITSQKLQNIKKLAVLNNFQIDNDSKDTLSLKPKEFIVQRGVLNIDWPARVNIQFIKIEDQVNYVISYDCSMGNQLNGNSHWKACYSHDVEVKNNIEKKHKEVIQQFKLMNGN